MSPDALTTATLDAYRAAGGRGETEVGRFAAAITAYVAAGGPDHPETEVREIIEACARERLDWLLETTVAWQERHRRSAAPDYPPPRGWPEPNLGDPG